MREFQLDHIDYISEKELLQAIELRVAKMLDENPDLLMSYLYRMDVLEKDLNAILAKGSPVNPVKGIAQLILKRQQLRVELKEKYKSDPIKEQGWEW